MTYAKASAITGEKASPWHPLGDGLMAAPGKYTATLYKRVGSDITQLANAVEFELQPAFEPALSNASYAEVEKFGQQIVAAEKRSSAAAAVLNDIKAVMKAIRTALNRTPGEIDALEKHYAEIQAEIHAINVDLYGLESRNQMGIKPANISSRLGYAMSGASSSYGPTQQHREQFGYALEGLNEVSQRLHTLQRQTIPALQQAMSEAGSPWTTGAPLPQ